MNLLQILCEQPGCREWHLRCLSVASFFYFFNHQTTLLEEKKEHLIQFNGQNLNTKELIAEASGNITQMSQWCLEVVENDIFICRELRCDIFEIFILWRNFFFFSVLRSVA